jgi:DNA-nicking Smr family endonuclease
MDETYNQVIVFSRLDSGMQQPFKKLKELSVTGKEVPAATKEKFVPPDVAVPQEMPDEELFQWAMKDVTMGPWSHAKEPISPEPPCTRAVDEDQETMHELESLVDGSGPFDFSFSDEYIERAVAPSARVLLRKLRRGQYATQAVLDLHGMDRDEARTHVEQFILRSVGMRCGCVKIIHGRGHNSKENRAVLKGLLQLWLATRRMSRYVLAYTSARPSDGGAGAIYVLLRKPKKS